LISEQLEALSDGITKDAIREIPSYGAAPLKVTSERVERWLKILSESIRRNEPQLLADYLSTVALQRQEEGYAIKDLHAIVFITERHLLTFIDRLTDDPVVRSGERALLNAVMDSARMVLGVAYILSKADTSSS
jgi:hypothetical protein